MEGRALARIYNIPVSPGVIWWTAFQEGCQQPPLPLPLPLLHVGLGLVLVCPTMRWNGWGSWVPGKNHYLFLYFLFICLFHLFWVLVCFIFPGDRVYHPAHYTNRMILQEGHRRNKLLARARNCTGQLKHPLAHRVPDHSFNPFGDPLPAMVIFISMSATTDSLLNGP